MPTVNELRERLNTPIGFLHGATAVLDELRWSRAIALNLLMEVEALRLSQRDLRAKLQTPTQGEPMAEDLHQRIERDFTNYAPADDRVINRFLAIRVRAKDFAHTCVDLCPPSRELSMALTDIERGMQAAVSAIARNQNRLPSIDAKDIIEVRDLARRDSESKFQAPGTTP